MRRRAEPDDPEWRHLTRAALFLASVFLLRSAVWYGYYNLQNTARDPRLGDVQAHRHAGFHVQQPHPQVRLRQLQPTHSKDHARVEALQIFARHIGVPALPYGGALNTGFHPRNGAPLLDRRVLAALGIAGRGPH